MQKVKIYLIIAGIVIIASAFVTANILIKQNRKLKIEIARVQANNMQLMSENMANINLNVSFKEFKQSVSNKIDSLLKVSEIALKQVKTVTITNNYYIDSSKTIIKPVPIISKNDTIYPFIDIKDCFLIGGFMKVRNDFPELVINKREFKNETTIIGYEKRPHKFLFFRWGKKETYIESHSDCGGSETRQINIIKK